jgi:hypothetical protein
MSCGAFSTRYCASLIRWKLILGDLVFTGFMLFTTLAIVALAYEASPNMVQSVIGR